MFTEATMPWGVENLERYSPVPLPPRHPVWSLGRYICCHRHWWFRILAWCTSDWFGSSVSAQPGISLCPSLDNNMVAHMTSYSSIFLNKLCGIARNFFKDGVVVWLCCLDHIRVRGRFCSIWDTEKLFHWVGQKQIMARFFFPPQAWCSWWACHSHILLPVGVTLRPLLHMRLHSYPWRPCPRAMLLQTLWPSSMQNPVGATAGEMLACSHLLSSCLDWWDLCWHLFLY